MNTGFVRSSVAFLLSLSLFGSAILDILLGIIVAPTIPGPIARLIVDLLYVGIGGVALLYSLVEQPDYTVRARPLGVTLLAGEVIVIGVITIFEGLFLLLLPVIGIFGVIIAGLGLGLFKLGRGIWGGKEWSREIMLVVSAIGVIVSILLEFFTLSSTPILAVYQLWYLRRPHVGNYFSPTMEEPPTGEYLGPAGVEGFSPNDLLSLQDLRVHFPVKMPFVQRFVSREKPVVHAVDGVSFQLRAGEILGLVGESGCGKTTVGRASVGLLKPTSGRIIFEGRNISALGEAELRPLRRRMQIVFQDPHASLNPAMTIGEAIGHPLWIHRLVTSKGEARKRVYDAMREVGLTPEEQLYDKYPADLSGGQRQRAVIARAMILEPRLLVVDEGVAMLDMSIRAKVLQLMLDLKRKHGLTYLFITHDLATAKLICDRLAIMYLGRIVEVGPAREIYADPKHPYTRALLQVIPVPDPDRRRKKVLPRGEVPDAVHPPAGCRFHPRCPEVLATCGWEGRDFLDLLDEHLSDPNRAGDDEKILGPIEDWWAKGFAAGRQTNPDTVEKVVERVKAVLEEAPVPMAQAVQSVSAQGGLVLVRFHTPDELARKPVDGRIVECLLYQ